MMATNDTEFALYQRLDKEREAARRATLQASSPLPPLPSRAKKAAVRKPQEDELDEVPVEDEAQDGGEKDALPPLPPRLMTVAQVPLWARSQEAWFSKHHQLLAMSEQVDKNNLQVGNGNAYTVEAEGDDEEDSNLDAASVDGVSGGGRGLGGSWSASTRKRKSTTGLAYDDGLTETQFMELVEKSEQVGSPFTTAPLTDSLRRLRSSRTPRRRKLRGRKRSLRFLKLKWLCLTSATTPTP
jgi:hypothetical protein